MRLFSSPFLSVLVTTWTLGSLVANAEDAAASRAIPFDQIGYEAGKDYSGEGISIVPSQNRAHLKALFQDLEADVTPEGMWVRSTSDHDRNATSPFRIRAIGLTRSGGPDRAFAHQGSVRATPEVATFFRDGVIEEYRVSMDGIRQDFLIPARPDGWGGSIRLILDLDGGSAVTTNYGARLTIQGDGREIAYSRLHVTDATGKELVAQMRAISPALLEIEVADEDATYPLRIDPTLSDADWVSTGGIAGTDGIVYAISVDPQGKVYIGGTFTGAGNVHSTNVACWDGSGWCPMGEGVQGSGVFAILATDDKVYLGGRLTAAGDLPINHIAEWDGANWSDMAGGTGNEVDALVQI
ncbi:MAG: hypothetical protein KDL87_08435, partial [Verrucomicrobiae bacterium]|nr:hypothetical protein [Verrucomicrobiae bacterium]